MKLPNLSLPEARDLGIKSHQMSLASWKHFLELLASTSEVAAQPGLHVLIGGCTMPVVAGDNRFDGSEGLLHFGR